MISFNDGLARCFSPAIRAEQRPHHCCVMPVPWEETSLRHHVYWWWGRGSLLSGETQRARVQNLASMGIYIFSTDLFLRLCVRTQRIPESSHDFGGDIIWRCLMMVNVFAYRFEGFWAWCGGYYCKLSARPVYLALGSELPAFDIFSDKFPACPMLPPVHQRTLALFGEVQVDRLSGGNGCQIFGYSRYSILSTPPRCRYWWGSARYWPVLFLAQKLNLVRWLFV